MTTTTKHHFPKGYSLFQVLFKTNDFLKNPVRFVEKSMDKFGDTYGATLPGGRKIIWTRDSKFIDDVLRINQRKFIKSDFATGRAAHFFGNGLVFSKGAYWRRQRRLIQPGFHRQKLMGLYDVMIKTIQETLEEMPIEEPVDIYPLMGNLSFKVLVNSLFDISLSKELMTELNQLFNELQQFIMDESNKPYMKLFYPINGLEKKQYTKAARIRTILSDIIQVRKNSSHTYTDILDMLLNSRYEDTGEAMNEEQIIDELLVLLFAGFETSSNVLSWLVYLLANNKPAKEKLVATLSGKTILESSQNEYLKATVNEGLRMYPAAWMTERISLEEVTFGEYLIPKDTHILSFFYGLHRNEKYWDAPNEFEPERFLKDGKMIKTKNFFPFGVGPRTFFEKFDVERTGQVPEMNPLLTLQPDKVILKIKPR